MRRHTMRRRAMPTPCWALMIVVLFVAAGTQAADAPPDTPKHTIVDTIFGTAVHDDYRWLEDWSDTTVQHWSKEQNSYARHYLDALPARSDILARIDQLTHNTSPSYRGLRYCHGVFF